jgi:hypothetical protein
VREERTIHIEVWLQQLSQPILVDRVTSTYTKGPLFCIHVAATNTVYKYPISTIFRVVERYKLEGGD